VQPYEPEQREAYFTARAKSHVQVVVAHVPFLVNVASEDSGAWRRSRSRLVTELERAEELGIAAVVLHPGSGGLASRRQAVRRSAKAIAAAVTATKGYDVRILVENMAGQGRMLCACFEEIAELLALVDEPARTGVCFDTAHAFIAGYPFSGYTGYADVVGELAEIVGLDQVRALHVNDSLTGHGSRHDRHAPVGQGEMGLEAFHALMRDPAFAEKPMILEVPDRDGQSLAVLNLLRRLKDRRKPVRSVAGPLQLALSGAQKPDRLPRPRRTNEVAA
jgi:deoxyribonuclease-4